MAGEYVNRKGYRRNPPSARSASRRPNGSRGQRVIANTHLASTDVKPAPAKGYPFYMAIGALVIAICLLLFVIVNCAGGEKTQAHEVLDNRLNSAIAAVGFAFELADNVPDKSALADIIGQEDAEKLLDAARTDRNALWIASHVDELAKDGPEAQEKILELAVAEPTSYDFAKDFAKNFPAFSRSDNEAIGMSAEAPSDSIPDTRFPHFYQWDRRWGNTVYCSTAFGLTGCGPTSLAMIYQGLTGADDIDPYDMGLKAQEAGYMDEYNGTQHGFFYEVAYDLGLSCQMEDPSADLIVSSLSAGKPIIINFGPGYFTRYGHFAVLAGLDDDGRVIMNDPYSVVRSSQTWDASLLADEAFVMYVYSNEAAESDS